MAREHLDRQPVSRAALWFGLLGSPVAWSLRLVISYALVQPLCATGWGVALHVVTAGFILVALAAGFVAWQSYQTVPEQPPAGVDDWMWGRVRFMSMLGLLLSGFLSLVMVAEWLPIFFIDPCVTQ